MADGTELDPFVALNLRAFIEGSPEEMAVVGALVLWKWWKGQKEAPGLVGITAVSGLSRTTAYRTVLKMKKKGWVESFRGFNEKLQYKLTIPKMDFKEGYSLLEKRLPAKPFDDPQFALFEIPKVSTRNFRRSNSGKVSTPVYRGVKTLDLQSKTEGQTGPQARFRAGRMEGPKDQGQRLSKPEDKMPMELKEALKRLLDGMPAEK